jgi:hypothetical protein
MKFFGKIGRGLAGLLMIAAFWALPTASDLHLFFHGHENAVLHDHDESGERHSHESHGDHRHVGFVALLIPGVPVAALAVPAAERVAFSLGASPPMADVLSVVRFFNDQEPSPPPVPLFFSSFNKAPPA